MGGAHCIKIGIYSHIESIGLIQVSSPLWITNLKYIEIIKITKMQELAKILVRREKPESGDVVNHTYYLIFFIIIYSKMVLIKNIPSPYN